MPRIPPKEHQFKPGTSGNPAGRPKGAPDIRNMIAEFFKRREKMLDPTTGKEKKLSVGQRIVLAQISQALKGNTKAFNALVDRLEGKAVQPVSGPDGEPIQMMPPQIIFQGVAATGEKAGE